MDSSSLLDIFKDARADFTTTSDLSSGQTGNLFSMQLHSLENAYAASAAQQHLGFADDSGEPLRDDEQPSAKRAKLSPRVDGGPQRASHITVERNRRKQMNAHLSVLRSLIPSFYVKRGDQASIIGGVVEYIKELQQILKSLEEKKQRKIYTGVLSPRTATSSPRFPSLSPKPPPLSARVTMPPISPRTPQQVGSPYSPKLHLQVPHLSTFTNMAPSLESSPSLDGTIFTSTELAACSRSLAANVEVKFVGANVEVKTVSHGYPGQALKIMSVLEGRSLEILHASISVVDAIMLNSFTIKIGIECELSAQELAQEIQQTLTC